MDGLGALIEPILVRVPMSDSTREDCRSRMTGALSSAEFWARDALAVSDLSEPVDPRPFAPWYASRPEMTPPIEPSETAWDPRWRLERAPRPPRGSNREERDRVEERAKAVQERNSAIWGEYHAERWRVEIARTNRWLDLVRWIDALSVSGDGGEVLDLLDDALASYRAWKPVMDLEGLRARQRSRWIEDQRSDNQEAA